VLLLSTVKYNFVFLTVTCSTNVFYRHLDFAPTIYKTLGFDSRHQQMLNAGAVSCGILGNLIGIVSLELNFDVGTRLLTASR
jgi:hypothetical protein